MKRLNFVQRAAIALILLGLLAPSPLAAAPPADAPLPLPSVLFYGVARLGGEVLASGTVKAVLPRGGMVSAPIGPVAGTGYNYALSLPLGMPAAGSVFQDPDTATFGDTIRFYLNGTMAVFRDQTGLTRADFTIPADAVGTPYLINLALVGPEAYPLGDVNANGVRDSADSLLVLRYDVGLTSGGQIFPPGPRTIYLPLCDIVSDGRCNSSDALRILQCDAGMPGVVCPPANSGIFLLSAPAAITQTAPVVLRTDFAAEPEAGLVTVRVLADDPLGRLGAASLDLRYDTASMSVQGCAGNPDGLLDAGFCNSAYLTGTVRVNAASVRSAGTRPVLAAVSFRLTDPAAAAPPSALQQLLSHAITLTAQAVFDSVGERLPWRVEGPGVQGNRVYLPLVFRGWNGGGAAPSPSATPSATALPTPSGTPTASATATPSATPILTPTLVPTASPTATPSALPTNTPTLAPAPSATSTPTPSPLPAATPSATPTPSPTPPAVTPSATSTSTPAPAPTATPSATPSAQPTSTPTATPALSATPTPTPSPVRTSTPTVTPAGSASTGPALPAAAAAWASGPDGQACRV